MCNECGCGGHDHADERMDERTIVLDRPVREANDRLARANRHLLDGKGVLCVNLMGAPGSGKTTVIEGLASLAGKERIAVIQGDLESDIDKRRLEERGIATFQINTHSGCHLNAQMVSGALKEFPVDGKEYLLIENVGNLVCPAGVRLGQHIDIVVSATTEGSDKPRKYPHIFREAKAVLVTKIDLKEAVDFDQESYLADLRLIAPRAKPLLVTKKDPGSFRSLLLLLEHERAHLLGEEHTH